MATGTFVFPIIWLIILCRIVANPFSNVFQKILTRKRGNAIFIILMTHAFLAACCLLMFFRWLPGLPRAFWINIIICAALAVSGNALLVQALKLADLSVLGPINAYKSVVSLLPGLIFLHEVPGGAGLAGIGLIVAGSYFIVDRDVARPSRNLFVRFFSDRGVQYRFAALVLAATEAVFLKRAEQSASPIVTFAFWSVLGFAFSLIAIPFIGGSELRRQIQIARSNKTPYFLLFITTGLMQLCTIVALRALQVGYTLALFQTSTLLSVILGYKIFRERNFAKRLIGSAIMIAGAVLIIESA